MDADTAQPALQGQAQEPAAAASHAPQRSGLPWQSCPQPIYASRGGKLVAQPALQPGASPGEGWSDTQRAIARELERRSATLCPPPSCGTADELHEATALATAMLSHLTSCRGAVSSQIAASMGPIPVLQLLLMALRDWLHGGPLSPLGEAFYQIELLSVLLHKRAIRVAGTAAAAAGDGVTPEQRRAFERRVHAGKRFTAFNFCSMWAKGYQPEALLGLAAAVAVATGRGELVAAVLGCGASRLVHKHKHHGQTVADTAANPSEVAQLTFNMRPPNAPLFGVSYRRYGDAAGAHEVRQSQPAWSLTLTGRQLLGEAPVHTLPTLGGGAPVDAPASSWFLEHGVFPGSERVAIMGRLATGVLGDMSTLAEVIRDLPSSFTPADAELARARFIGNAALAELSEEMVHEAGIAYANAKLQLEHLAQRPEFQHQPASALAASLLHVASHASTTISTSSLHNSLQQRNVTPAGCAGTAASAANTPWLLMAAVLTDVGLPSIANSKLFARGAPHAALEELQRALAQPAGSEERRRVAERMVVGLRLHKLGAAQAQEVGASAATAAACMGLGDAAVQLGHFHGAIVHALKLMAEGLEGRIKFLGWCKRWADGMQQGQRSVSSLQDVVALINSNGGLNGRGLGAVTGRIGRFWGWVAAELPHVVGEVRQVLEDSRSGGADAADSEEGLRRAACAVNDALGDDADAEVTRGCVRAMAASMQSEDGGHADDAAKGWLASVNGERLDTIYGVGVLHDEALGMVGRQLRLEGQLQDGATLELVSVSKSGKGHADDAAKGWLASVNGERLDTIYGVGVLHDEALGMVGRQLRLEGQLQDGATLELVSVSKSGKGSKYFNGLGTTTQNRTGDRAGTVRTLQHHKEDAGVGGRKPNIAPATACGAYTMGCQAVEERGTKAQLPLEASMQIEAQGATAAMEVALGLRGSVKGGPRGKGSRAAKEAARVARSTG